MGNLFVKLYILILVSALVLTAVLNALMYFQS